MSSYVTHKIQCTNKCRVICISNSESVSVFATHISPFVNQLFQGKYICESPPICVDSFKTVFRFTHIQIQIKSYRYKLLCFVRKSGFCVYYVSSLFKCKSLFSAFVFHLSSDIIVSGFTCSSSFRARGEGRMEIASLN